MKHVPVLIAKNTRLGLLDLVIPKNLGLKSIFGYFTKRFYLPFPLKFLDLYKD